MIPRKIHQTSRTKVLPREIENNIWDIRRLNHDWSYKLYDNEEALAYIMENSDNRTLDAYSRIDSRYGAAKADLFRYVVMYNEGGLYLDIKSTMCKRLDEVLLDEDRYLLSHWNRGTTGKHKVLNDLSAGEFVQWYILSEPGHPYLKSVIESVVENIENYNEFIHGVGKRGVLKVTGPIAYTLAINRNLADGYHRVVDHKLDLGLEYSIYERENVAGNHLLIQGAHYSQHKCPIIRCQSTIDYARFVVFRIWLFLRRLKSQFHTAYRKCRSQLCFRT